MVRESYSIEIKKTAVCKAGSAVLSMFDALKDGEHVPVKSVIGTEKKMGKWQVFLDSVSDDNSTLYGVVVSVKNDKGETAEDTDIEYIISQPYEILLTEKEEAVLTSSVQK